MRSYARIGKKRFCLEKLIKPRKNKDMQGYETIWKEKLKFSWFATAISVRLLEILVKSRHYENDRTNLPLFYP